MRPTLVVAKDLVDGLFLVLLVVVGATEVFPVILQGRVLVATTGKVETKPPFDLIGIRCLFCPVVLVNFDNAAALGIVGACFVIQDRVPVDADVMLFGEFAELYKFLLATPFGCPCALCSNSPRS